MIPGDAVVELELDSDDVRELAKAVSREARNAGGKVLAVRIYTPHAIVRLDLEFERQVWHVALVPRHTSTGSTSTLGAGVPVTRQALEHDDGELAGHVLEEARRTLERSALDAIGCSEALRRRT